MSLFEMTPDNIQFFKSPASLETCMSKIGTRPYWNVDGRVCYHVHENPDFIIINHMYVSSEYIHVVDDYLHITNMKKPLYALSHYSTKDLEDMCNRLQLPVGKKRDMYDNISSIFKKN